MLFRHQVLQTYLLCAFSLSSLLPFFQISAQAAPPTSPTANPTAKSNTAVALQSSDARLTQNAPAILLPRVTLREFVARLSQESGVGLSLVELPKDAGEAELLVSLREKDRTLAQTMDALASLMSYQKAAWHWEQVKGTDGKYHYALRPSRALAGLADGVKKQIQSEFEAQDAAMQAALKMTPEQLREARKTNPNISQLPIDNEPQKQEGQYGLQTFFSIFSQAERQQILRGSGKKVIAFDSLPEVGKKFVGAMAANTGGNHTVSNIFIGMRPAGYDGVTPALIIGISGAEGNISRAFIGGIPTDKMWNARLTHQWQDKGDTFDNPSVDAKTTKPQKPATELPDVFKTLHQNDHVARFLYGLSDGVSVSLLSVLPPLPKSPPGSNIVISDPLIMQPWYGKPLREVLATLQTFPMRHLDHKWHEGVLLVRDASAPFAPDPGFRDPNF